MSEIGASLRDEGHGVGLAGAGGAGGGRLKACAGTPTRREAYTFTVRLPRSAGSRTSPTSAYDYRSNYALAW